MTPADRALDWNDISLLIDSARRHKVKAEVFVARWCNVDVETARGWVQRVRQA